ncbi:hypothetical protein [Xanthomonas floridensis]|uniref:Uncharacterized protein n=1 Tax=Xanthomonas floridensis TaxID=1843580 RepID=A0A1A9M7X7_9XANT|nr:hypothetical protein [Xanthomonas floridensis]MEA5123852.1 hypothetical protein [Xanthomonas floridensis]MEA5131531.1 hypothetical protein [Xanthomonas floridensis]OAG65670.1 hypothetical protein A7D17_08120 [Xanthomonas floridensis]
MNLFKRLLHQASHTRRKFLQQIFVSPSIAANIFHIGVMAAAMKAKSAATAVAQRVGHRHWPALLRR